MASSTAHSPSKIPLPVKSSPISTNIPVGGILMKDLLSGEHFHSSLQQSAASRVKGNGNIKPEKLTIVPVLGQEGKRIETFLMTGEMIIHNKPLASRTLPQHGRPAKIARESYIPRLGQDEQKLSQQPKESCVISSPKLPSKIPAAVKNHSKQLNNLLINHHSSTTPDINHHGQVSDFSLVHAPFAEMEELSDLSHSSCSESELCLDKDSDVPGLDNVEPCLSLPLCQQLSHTPNTRLEQATGNLYKLKPMLSVSSNVGISDSLQSDAPNSGDSGYVHGCHISDQDLSNKIPNNSDHTFSTNGIFFPDEALTDKEEVLSPDDITPNVGMSSPFIQMNTATPTTASNGEKFLDCGGNTERSIVRTSKSHENYLQDGNNVTLVSIDIVDNLAYSLDTLTYHDSLDSSLDNLPSDVVQTSRSLDNSPEKKSEKLLANERDFIPDFIGLDNSKSAKLKLYNQSDDKNNEETDRSGNYYADLTSLSSSSSPSGQSQSFDNIEVDNFDLGSKQRNMLPDDGKDTEGYHQHSKAVDRPSAERLARRLFLLEGFRKSDVSRHLCKKNDFSNLVAEEYLKFFDFQNDTLDFSLRKFLIRFSLYGETQERERVLAHFSRRFMECNSGSFNSEDACHTLTCAIMLLNSDLHSPNVGRRMTCQEFIENLAGLNDGNSFSKEVLKAIYQSIKNEPFEWAIDDFMPEQDSIHTMDQAGSVLLSTPNPQILGNNPFLEVPDPNKTTEYKKGYVMRKCCMEPDRRKTAFGKRGWKMMYAVLRDMILYQYKDEHQLKKGQFVEGTHNAIRIHHALATKALDYTKKQHVFRLQTAEWAEYLFQTGDSKELQEWVDMINLVAASMSAPVLAGAVGSRTKFQRQLLPSLCTRLNLNEQYNSHESRINDLEHDLYLHRTCAPEKGAKSSVIQEYLDKEKYLEYEIKRFKIYICHLQIKMSSLAELDSSLGEASIEDIEEMGAGPSPNQLTAFKNTAEPVTFVQPLQRSMSDRYSYRSALYQTQYDMV